MLVRTQNWGGDSECADQEVCLYAQGPGEEIVSALTRRYACTQRPGEEIVSALTRRYACTHSDLGRK